MISEQLTGPRLENIHLAPYFPYGLKVKHKNRIWILKSMSEERIARLECDVVGRDWKQIRQVSYDDFTPIIRHRSDMIKKINHKGESFIPIEEINRLSFGVIKVGVRAPEGPIIYMDSWFFDRVAYDLIESGLAINYNDLLDHCYQ